MLKSYYYIVLALKGYRLIGIKGNAIAGINIKDKSYSFWYFQKPFRSLILYDSCKYREEAKFKWNILIKEVFKNVT